ncbi:MULTISPECIES: M16 family metallopeptidase [Pseudoalteromonas]|jgi:zinc protease|uniref:Pitrilysin family protein n=1 Tax=Pseudoalteromonas marina TaxID=267375 RepID=A0ABT9FIE0_9GAMM|nr:MULTISPECIES: pitrilysin family protein [Pseudoalteromonas]MCK8122588.1 insulinase family protein [Pseudoalteromonas sp. 2CM32C]MDP2566542.1 pitrilysin family protein [Pseudoalteromonas marina]
MKLSKIALAVLLASGLAACNSSTQAIDKNTVAEVSIPGVTLIESVQANPNDINIPYKKYKLDNGLTVIVHEDHSDPLVHVDVTYHVGSAREELGKSGFAHFFEHMMFQGSENVADEEHFKIISEAGGTLNGTTNSDRTNYFETVPVNQLEKMLWLESDRMGFLLDAVTQEKFEVQRETVKNERGQRVDNRPYGRLGERMAQAMYPDGHPYSWPVIGFMDDLNRVNVNDLKAFFLKWYGPNNATLTIGGDINANEILPLVTKYFAPIPKGPEIPKVEKKAVTLNADRYISMEDKVHLPLLAMSFPTTYARSEDEAPLDILAEILGGGNNSLLYKNLVKTQLAVQASANHPCQELSCSISIYALPNPTSGKTLADMEKIVRDSFTEFEKRGVTQDDLDKVKAKIESGAIFGLQSVSGKVSQLAASETFTGNPNSTKAEIARYNSVTKADVMRVFNQYIKGKSSVIMSVVPEGQTQLIAAPDNFTPKKHDFGGPSTTSADDLVARRAVDTFDRSVQPVAGANPAVDVPALWQTKTDNGIKILGTQSSETPTTAVFIKIPGGFYNEQTSKVGLSSMTASLMSESTQNYTTEEMSNALEKLGSQVSIYADKTHTNVYVSTLTKNLDATLKLVEEKLFRPAFNADDFERNKKQIIQNIQHSMKDAGYLASNTYSKLLYGDNIAALPSSGTLNSIEAITLDDVETFYKANFKPQGAQVIIVSDLSEADVEPKVKSALANWQGKGQSFDVDFTEPNVQTNVIYLVDKPGAPQSQIRIGKRDMVEDITGEFFKANLMNFALGGTFNSRINLNLREDKGYTYGARSRFWGDKTSGGFTASAAVRADSTAASITEFTNELNNYAQNGVTDEELMFMRKAINQKDALKYETPNAKLGFLAQILEFDLEPNFVKERNKIVSTISKEEINALAKKHLNAKDMIYLVVGDAKTLRPELEKLGMKVVDYSL